MITLNGVRFAEHSEEMEYYSFSSNSCKGFYKVNKRSIDLYDRCDNLIGVINQECVLGSARALKESEKTKPSDKYWYSYGTPMLIGEYESLTKEREEVKALAIGQDHIGYYFK